MPQIDQFLGVLVEAGGSDLHLSVGVPPVLRIHGGLRQIPYEPLTQEQVSFLLREIMNEEKAAEFATEMQCDFAYAAPSIGRFRVNAFTQRNGAAAVFRTVPTKIPSAEELGLPMTIRQLAALHKGLVLITGATGSGKSTTLASLIHLINTNRPAHVLTIEDPIEFVHESKKALINQREVGQHTKSFARALKAALREDPDVILVGEMRDVETFELACTAAETGHLVFATLHTNSAAKAIDRIVNSFPSEQQQQIRMQLSETLRAVVAQQLIPKIGGKGRVAAYEIMIANPAIQNLIRESKDYQIPSVMGTGKKDGMQTMDAAIAELIRRGVVDPKEGLAKAHNRKYVEQELAKDGIRVA